MKNNTMVNIHQKMDCGPMAADAASWSTTSTAHTVNKVMSNPFIAFLKPRFSGLVAVMAFSDAERWYQGFARLSSDASILPAKWAFTASFGRFRRGYTNQASSPFSVCKRFSA